VVGGALAAMALLFGRMARKPSTTGGPTREDPDDPDVPEPVDTEPDEPDPDAPRPKGPAKPIHVGPANDPETVALLSEMDDYFRSQGVDNTISAREVTVMRKTKSQASAIPPRAYWPRMARTLRELWNPLRQRMGVPLTVRGGYRPPDYNAAVGGASGSRHVYFEAIDIYPHKSSNSLDTRKRLALEGARLWIDKGDEHKVGLGVYGTKTNPTNIHVDTGAKKRTWKKARHWIEIAKKVA